MSVSTLTGWTGFWNRWRFRLVVGLFVVAGLIAVAREVANYRSGRGVDGGHLALAVGIPAMFYALLRSTQGRADEEKQKEADRHQALVDEASRLPKPPR